MRWTITSLIAAAIAISYFDRQTLPVAIAAIQRDIPISNTQFSQLQAAFLTAYALDSHGCSPTSAGPPFRRSASGPSGRTR